LPYARVFPTIEQKTGNIKISQRSSLLALLVEQHRNHCQKQVSGSVPADWLTRLELPPSSDKKESK